jgi:amino acid adenylation domain-containing protein
VSVSSLPGPALEELEFDPFSGGTVERVIATSAAQREVWLADKLSLEASLAFNESVSLELSGPLDPNALQAAVVGLLARHASLRSTIGPEGTELLVGADAVCEMPLSDLSSHGEPQARQMLLQAAERAVQTPFDLERGPLFRAELFRISASLHVLMLTAHHIVCDGWSWGLIAEDLGALYAERLGAGPSPGPADDYGDYVGWEAGEGAGVAGAAHEHYWLGRYGAGSLPVLELPTDRRRPARRSFESRRIDHVLPASLVSDVQRLGGKLGASLFGTLFAGFAATLQRLTGQQDLVIGVPAAGQSASGLMNVVGHCVNLLPVRVDMDPALPFEACARQASGTLLDAFDHQALTYGALLAKLPVQRDPSRLPLVSVMFNVDQAVRANSEAYPGLQVELSSNPRRFENFELFVNATRLAGGALRVECQYNTGLFDALTVERWLRCYEALLRSAVEDAAQALGAMAWLAAEDKTALAALQPPPSGSDGGELMHSSFVRAAHSAPSRAALRHGAERLSYLELEQRSNRMAQALRARGIQRGARVGLCLHRGPEMLVALLGVLKCGATYVPLDPGFPPARLAYYAEDAQLALLLTESTVATAPTAWCIDASQRVLQLDVDRSWLQQPADALPPGPADALPADAAYIIYTSGSTGKPKGVCVPHRAVSNFLASMRVEPGIEPDDRLAAVTTLSFDIAVLELLLPLCVGAEVIIVPRETAMDGNLLKVLLASTGATLMQATPGMWRALLEAGWEGGSRFRVLVGGESVPADLANDLLDRSGEVWNMYGPTETTVWSTTWRIDRAALAERGMSIGRPIANTTVWIVDAAGQACPIGVPGEICIGGQGVALGYLDRPELTADRFVVDPFAATGARMYRTGDRGRWRNDGLLEHLGRLDFQVKVRGYRIELGEIEAACSEQTGVSGAVVLAREDHPGDVRLVAYLTLSPGAQFDESALRLLLRNRLPDYMLPQHVVVLDGMPRLPNGKIDRKALPAPTQDGAAAAGERLAPRTDLERLVVEAMEAVLKLPGLGVRDDFFALGGHSLLAARLTSRLNRDLGLTLSLRTLFESPTAEKMAQAVQLAQAAGMPAREPIRHDPERRSAPLTPMQERIRFMDELYPGRTVYNTPSAHRLSGPMDVAAFGRAFARLVDRQPALRTFIARRPDGSHEQRLAEDIDVSLPLVDLSAEPAERRESRLQSELAAIIGQPIGLYEPPLFRCALYRLDPNEHVFLFVPHHIVWDGWSFDVLYEDLAALYVAELTSSETTRAAPALSYFDYAHWYEQWLQGDEARAQLGYWTQRFSRVEAPRALPTDRPRRAGMIGAGAWQLIEIDNPLLERLRSAARSLDVTVNVFTMAVLALMLGRLAASPSVVLGMPVRGRQAGELDNVMGFFNNLLPIPVAIDSATQLADVVRTLKRELMDAMAHQEVPFEWLSAEPEVSSRASASGL